ncbi:MAG: hypothetical protein ACYDC2_00990 [Solirubrobacteraceae bacterium]
MNEAVAAGAIAVAALNLIPGLLGAWVFHAGTPTGRAGRAFWPLLRVGQGAALTLALAAGSLAAAGKDAREGLFYLYALLPLAIAFVAEQLRAASAQAVLDQRGIEGSEAVEALAESEQHGLVASILRRETGVMAASALVVVFLALRAAGTAHGF